MAKTTAIGKYVIGDSITHKMDPRIKFLINLLLIVIIFLTDNLITLGIILAPVFIAYLASGLDMRKLYKSLLPVFTISIFIFLINIFLSSGENDYVSYWKWKQINITDNAIKLGVVIGLRIYTMILATTILTSTTKPMALSRAIEDLLSPLKLLRIRVNIIAQIISIALRFIPTLLEETQRIMKAQASRGVDFSNGNVKTKVRSLITLIIPLFVSAFSKAEDLANAMTTRGYDPYEKRTRYRHYVPHFTDYFWLLVFAGLLAFVIVLNVDVMSLPSWGPSHL